MDDLMQRILDAAAQDLPEARAAAKRAGAISSPVLQNEPKAGYYWEFKTPTSVVILRTAALSALNGEVAK